jgi:hypothetical protein
MKRILIGFGVNGNGLDPQLVTGTDDSKCYLATVSDEDLFKGK